MTASNKIAIIIVFFGRWPEWTPYFLRSCSVNKNIHWILFSEKEPAGEHYRNVQFIKITPGQLEKLIRSTLHVKPVIIHPYKLTDFKPAYGLIFRDYIQDCSHWGYSDLDLIFGSVNHFISDRMLVDFDIISPSPDFFPGHFLLMKNNQVMLNLFKEAVNWKEIFESKEYHCFDEHLLSRGIIPDDYNILRQVIRKSRYHIREHRLIRNPVTRMIKSVIPLNFRNQRITKPMDFNQVIRKKTLAGN